MYKDIKALSKIAVKIDMAYTAAGMKRLIKKRLLKRAIATENRLIKAAREVMPLHVSDDEVKDMIRRQLAQTKHNIINKIGHTLEFKVSRTERRRITRLKAKESNGLPNV